jgi:hypothetical protein
MSSSFCLEGLDQVAKVRCTSEPNVIILGKGRMGLEQRGEAWYNEFTGSPQGRPGRAELRLFSSVATATGEQA